MKIDRRGFFSILAGSLASFKVLARRRKLASSEALGLLYDASKCIGCKACVKACTDANQLSIEHGPGPHAGLYHDPQQLSGNTKNIIKEFIDGRNGRRSYVKQQCMHCIDPACVSACMLGALYKAENDIVAYDEKRCLGCRYCQIACPYNVPRFQWQAAAPLIVKCELCRHLLAEGMSPACSAVCPTGAVKFGKRSELLTEAKRRLADEPSRYNPKIYGERDAGGTQALYLAAAGIAFSDLGLPDLGEEGAAHLSESVQHGVYKYFAAPVVLYGVLLAAVWRARHGCEKANDWSDGEGAER